MKKILQIGNKIINETELLPLLTQHQMLPQLVREIVVDQGIIEIVLTPEEILLAHQSFRQKYKISSDEQLQIWLAQNYLNSEQLEQILIRPLKIEKFKQQTFFHKIDSYFLKRKSQLDQFIYSLVRIQRNN
jgi:hypothetical protein